MRSPRVNKACKTCNHHRSVHEYDSCKTCNHHRSVHEYDSCKTCNHHRSVHEYDSERPREGPKKCQVPNCTCDTYVQREPR